MANNSRLFVLRCFCDNLVDYARFTRVVYEILLISGNLTEAYKQRMQAYDQCHFPTVRSLWDAFCSELSEFFAEPSQDEAWDVLHSFGRISRFARKSGQGVR